MTPEEIKESLQTGRRVYGTLIVSPSPKWPLAVQNTGIDFVFIDTEHIAIDRTTLSWMCRMYREIGTPAIVRIPSPNPYEACKVLDGGACGIIAPYVESVDEVKELVGATKYRPLKGHRLKKSLNTSGEVDYNLKKYIEKFCNGNILIINIESQPAVENLDQLLSVPGVDGVLIGPHDLSSSLGIPEEFDNPLFDRTVRKIIEKARKHHVGVGIHFWSDIKMEISWVKAGANLIIHSSDDIIFAAGLRKDIQTIKKNLGDQVKTEYDATSQIV